MSLPHSAFADCFRAEVVPRLRSYAAALAHDMVSGHLGYSDVAGVMESEALRSGASYMPEAHYEALMDWIAATAIAEIEKALAMQIEAETLVASLLREPDRAVIRESIRRFANAG